MEKIRILFLSANPRDTQFLKLADEFKEIDYHILKSPRKDLLELISKEEVRATALINLLQQHKPHIVHFCGHGEEDGIFLLDDRGRSILVDNIVLQRLFSLLKENIRLVILNACHTDSQAKEIAEIVGCAIGMSKAVNDEDAILFAASLYENIAFECPIGKAFELSELQLKLAGRTEAAAIPILHKRSGIDPNDINLFKQLYIGSRLLMYPDLWNSYANAMNFAKHVHHTFQTLDVQHLNTHISDLERIRGVGGSITFQARWSGYINAYDNLMQNYTELSKLADESFNQLRGADDSQLRQMFAKLYEKYYGSITTDIGKYSDDHDEASMLIMNQRFIRDEGERREATIQVSGLLNRARNLTTNSDNLLRSLISVLLEA